MSDIYDPAIDEMRDELRERFDNGKGAGPADVEPLFEEIDRLRAELAEREQEPVAWMTCDSAGNNIRVFDTRKTANDMATRTGGRAIPLYTRPPDAVPKGWRLCSLSLGRFPDENHLN